LNEADLNMEPKDLQTSLDPLAEPALSSPVEQNPPTAENELPPEKPSTVRYVFFGADGLRAGWGLLLYIAILFACGSVAHYVQTSMRNHGSGAASSTKSSGTPESTSGSSNASKPMEPRSAVVGEGIVFLVVMFVTFVLSRVEGRSFGTYGLGGSRRLPQFLAGLFWGVVCLSLLVGSLRWMGFLQFDGRVLGAAAALRYGTIWAVGALCVGLVEENLLRGYAQFTLARGLAGIYGAIFPKSRHRHALGFWTAALILSFVFGFSHGSNPGESPIGLLAAGLAGLVFCFSLFRTGSLWWAIGIHASWDWAQSFLYGVPDSGLTAEGHFFATHPVGRPIFSGGLTGPEGSIFAIVMLAVIAGIIAVTLRQSHRPGEGLASPDGEIVSAEDPALA
jgi:uncharacterized protein